MQEKSNKGRAGDFFYDFKAIIWLPHFFTVLLMVFLECYYKFVLLPLIMFSEDFNLVCINLNKAADDFRPALSNHSYSGVSEQGQENLNLTMNV